MKKNNKEIQGYLSLVNLKNEYIDYIFPSSSITIDFCPPETGSAIFIYNENLINHKQHN